MNWEEVKAKKSIYLNLGGKGDCHPQLGYENYIAIDSKPPRADWTIEHNLEDPIPLPSDSVDRILSEDFFEHIAAEEIKKIICECFRILRPGGFMRIGVPDYNNPKDRPYLKEGKDPRYPGHITLTTYDCMKRIIGETPFKRYRFRHYWDKAEFVFEKIDYTLGMVKRTRDNDLSCKRIGVIRNVKGIIKDLMFIVSRGFKCTWQELQTQEGHHLHVTSLIVDLYKEQ
ncbi:MAG: class I SAM-dependent methyltransferase [Candidatus Omnitrophica bacterium]|nr:class I SAM-dependent methyltransferase [Candidatus Omnitrophota bacterium]